MKGKHVPEHYAVLIEPRKAVLIRDIMKDVRRFADAGRFGLQEDEDEALEEMIDALVPPDGDEMALA